MGRGKDKSEGEKRLIVNLYNHFLQEKTLFEKEIRDGVYYAESIPVSFRKVKERTAAALKVSPASVMRYVAEARLHPEDFSERPTKRNCGRKPLAIDSFTEGVIRRKLLEAYSAKSYLTIKSLRTQLMDDQNFPKMSVGTLWKVMRRQLKFKFLKFHGKPVPFERADISASRHKYLKSIRLYRSQGYTIYYQDESWVNESHAPTKGWHIPEKEVLGMGDTGSHVDAWLKGVGRRFTENLMGGVTGKPSGAGRRIIMLYIGSTNGFLPEVGKSFIGAKDKKHSDYHDEMNSQHFYEWMLEVLNKIPDKSIIVLDQASYHKQITDGTKHPTTQWRKAELIDWLVRQNVPIPPDYETFAQLTVPTLRNISKMYHIQEIYQVEEMATNCGKDVKIIWMPVAHWELNPIELIWSQVKRRVGLENKFFKIKDVLKLTEKSIAEVTADDWNNCMDHIIKLEQLFVDKEKIIDDFVCRTDQRIIIPLDEDSTDYDTVGSPAYDSLILHYDSSRTQC